MVPGILRKVCGGVGWGRVKCGGLGQFIGPPKLILPNLFDSSICFMRKDCDGGNGKWKKETKNCSPLLLVVARLTVTEC